MERVFRENASSSNSATVSDGRYIYNGDVVADSHVEPSTARSNKEAVRKKHSTFNIVSGLFLLAGASLLYTGNVIAVNQLMRELNDLHNRCNSIVSANEVLKAEIARKSSLDRISPMAMQEIGLTNPKEPPVWFEIDEDKLHDMTKK